MLAGILIVIGGMNRPRNPSMAEMLVDPDWVWSHTVLRFGFLALVGGLVLYGRATEPPPRTRRWLKWAVVGSVLQSIEMVLNTASVVDTEHLAAHGTAPSLVVALPFLFDVRVAGAAILFPM